MQRPGFFDLLGENEQRTKRSGESWAKTGHAFMQRPGFFYLLGEMRKKYAKTE